MAEPFAPEPFTPEPFTCGECGRERAAPSAGERAVGLCQACILYPLWFRDAYFQARLTPPHDGCERVAREMPHLAGAR